MPDKTELKVFKCPNCGKGAGYFQKHKTHWVLDGKVRPQVNVGYSFSQTTVIDRGMSNVIVPAVQVVRDICEECGTIFVREIKLGDTQLKLVTKTG